mmetsp:Transcript_17909/g.25079  ORF Transcript_17909/g.25079 Transcript_17909/m.25079 type:complete len:124 (+) Transcript_17909:158-529(+)
MVDNHEELVPTNRLRPRLTKRKRKKEEGTLSSQKKKKRKKKKKTQKATEAAGEGGDGGSPADNISATRPYYQGDPWPNRYGIRPGYRWDGRDRGNGWEKKRMLHLNNIKARAVEGYQWSASAM